MKTIKNYVIGASLFAVLTALLFNLSVFSVGESAKAQTTPDKRQWETIVVRGNSLPEGLQGVMNMKGEEGWELVSVIQSKDGNYVAYLKRRK